MTGIVIEDCKPFIKNSLRAFLRIRLPSGMVLHDVAIHERDGKAWASPPSKPMLDRAGSVMKDDSGKVRYVPIIEFVSKEVRDRFSQQVVEAVRQQHQEVLP